MADEIPDAVHVSRQELQEAAQTLSPVPIRDDQLGSRLDLMAELLADAGNLPNEPALVWRDDSQKVHFVIVGTKLVVGRRPAESGLAFPEDKSLSGTHFTIVASREGCELEDLNSRNGTAVNVPGTRLQTKALRDGDVIFAGKHTFAFSDPRRTS